MTKKNFEKTTGLTIRKSCEDNFFEILLSDGRVLATLVKEYCPASGKSNLVGYCEGSYEWVIALEDSFTSTELYYPDSQHSTTWKYKTCEKTQSEVLDKFAEDFVHSPFSKKG